MKFFAPAISPIMKKKECAAGMKMSVVKPMRRALPVIAKTLYAEICAPRQERTVTRDHAMILAVRPERLSVISPQSIDGDVLTVIWRVHIIRRLRLFNVIIKVKGAERLVLMTAFAKIRYWKNVLRLTKKQGKSIAFIMRR